MSNTRNLASNTLAISDHDTFPTSCKTVGLVSIFPSSPESGLVTIFTTGSAALLLDRADAIALRDWLDLAIWESRPIAEEA